ncbi:unnamed protein product [Prorocentrum cordatum]|uniref:Kinesin-like protein n=1 Tax=Prorocentrum cordatum TaxID=2364126 RepID=A0ABN9PSM1_9DINO|nr:unnamed protein product [Polarella glacialis]
MEPSVTEGSAAHGSNIRVAVRVRPVPGDAGIIEVLGQGTIVIRKEGATGGNEYLSSQQGRYEERSFDRVFGPQATQEEVYAWCCQPLVQGAIEEGTNATIFVYGATGAGKTHTMFGERDERQQGLIYRAIHEVFAAIAEREEAARPQVRVSFLELYNEKLYDLLQPTEGGGGYLCSLMEDERRGLLKIGNLSEVAVGSTEETLELLQAGLQLRKVESTAMNQRSSRSHAVFMLQMEGPRRNQNSKICLIDLAGSERASQTQNVGSALRDGAKINQSLLALANCINALGESSRAAERRATANEVSEVVRESRPDARERAKTPQRKPPYRDSKLTLLLKNSLVTGGLVSMIANVHPGKSHFEDSNNTLEYAKRTSSVKGSVVVRTATPMPPTAGRAVLPGSAAEALGAPAAAEPSPLAPLLMGSRAPATEPVKWRQRSLTPSRRAHTDPQAETPKGDRSRAKCPPMDFTFSTAPEGRATATFGSATPSSAARRRGAAAAGEADCGSPSGGERARTAHTERSGSPVSHRLLRRQSEGAEADGLRRQRSQPAAGAADAEARRQRPQQAARAAPRGPAGPAPGAAGPKRLSDPPPGGAEGARSPTPSRKPASPPLGGGPRQPRACAETPSPAPAASRQPGAEASADDASREVLMQVVQSLHAEKAAMDARMRSERAAMDVQLNAALADRARLEMECDQLRAANLEKDRQMAALLASMGQPLGTVTHAI